MPTIREYRVVLPLSLEEFERGRRWHKVEQIKLEQKLLTDETVKVTEFGERTLLREKTEEVPNAYVKLDEPVDHVIKGYGSGSPASIPVTFPLLARIGSFLDVLITKTVQLTEVESWESYPYFRSVSTNSSLRSSYQMIIEGICVPGNKSEENPLNLPENILKKRKVMLVDIACNLDKDDYRDGKDPVLFRSEKTGRGPLKPGVWMDETKPCITCYILVSIQFDFLGPLGFIAERYLHNGIFRAMTLHHRELFCYIDAWIDFSVETLKQEETRLQEELEEIVQTKLKIDLPHGGLSAVTDATKSSGEGEQAVGSVQTSVCSPIEFIKKRLLSCCAASNAGGSLGYFWMWVAFFCAFFGLFFAYMSQYLLF